MHMELNFECDLCLLFPNKRSRHGQNNSFKAKYKYNGTILAEMDEDQSRKSARWAWSILQCLKAWKCSKKISQGKATTAWTKEPASGLSTSRDHGTWFLCKRRILNHWAIFPRPQTLNWKATPYTHELHHGRTHTHGVPCTHYLCCLHYQSSPKVRVTNFLLVLLYGHLRGKKAP